MKPVHILKGILPVLLAAGYSAAAASAPASANAPLFDGLGNLHHVITTQVPLAQRYFDQGLTLLYGFNHDEAVRSFRAATVLDPDCAMAWWGVSIAHGPNINRPMAEEDVPQAWEALQRAVALKPKAEARDRAYIDALARRYAEKPPEDRVELDQAYADAMRELAANYPDDLDAAVLYCEAVMDTTPWNYWNKDMTPRPGISEVIQTLRSVLARNPDHPGANHFRIHVVEAGPTPEEGLVSARRLAHYAPQAGHLTHMPSHIYVRVGEYHEATLANERASGADRAYIAECRGQGFYPGVYYPHNLHFLWYATGLEGRSHESLRAAQQVAQYAADNYCGPLKVYEAPRFRYLPLLVHLRFGQWDDVLAAARPPATNDFLVDRAMWHFARGAAYAAKRNTEQAEAELVELRRISDGKEAAALDSPLLPVSGILRIARLVLEGYVAQARENPAEAVVQFEQAVEAQDALPYMEPPFWHYPVRQTLGAALLRSGDPVRAEAVFREDLKRTPRNGWGLLGLAESLRQQDKRIAAAEVESERQKAWQFADADLKLEWF